LKAATHDAVDGRERLNSVKMRYNSSYTFAAVAKVKPVDSRRKIQQSGKINKSKYEAKLDR